MRSQHRKLALGLALLGCAGCIFDSSGLSASRSADLSVDQHRPGDGPADLETGPLDAELEGAASDDQRLEQSVDQRLDSAGDQRPGSCSKASDCAPGLFCHPTTHSCLYPTCYDGYKNGSESDKDCGGSCPNACPAGKACTSSQDCVDLCDGSACRRAKTCYELKQAHALLASGTYTLGFGSAYCDMTYDNGGWTLVYTCLASNAKPSAGTVSPGTAAYLAKTTVKNLAQLSSQVHIRTRYLEAIRSATSTANAQPIVNLRQLDRLDKSYKPADWSGPMTVSPNNNLYTGGGSSGSYPEVVYWAWGNSQGLHISKSSATCRWDWQSEGAPNEDLEVYVR